MSKHATILFRPLAHLTVITHAGAKSGAWRRLLPACCSDDFNFELGRSNFARRFCSASGRRSIVYVPLNRQLLPAGKIEAVDLRVVWPHPDDLTKGFKKGQHLCPQRLSTSRARHAFPTWHDLVLVELSCDGDMDMNFCMERPQRARCPVFFVVGIPCRTEGAGAYLSSLIDWIAQVRLVVQVLSASSFGMSRLRGCSACWTLIRTAQAPKQNVQGGVWWGNDNRQALALAAEFVGFFVVLKTGRGIRKVDDQGALDHDLGGG